MAADLWAARAVHTPCEVVQGMVLFVSSHLLLRLRSVPEAGGAATGSQRFYGGMSKARPRAVCRHAHFVEEDLGETRKSVELRDRAHRDARCLHRHEDEAQAVMALGRVAGKQQGFGGYCAGASRNCS